MKSHIDLLVNMAFFLSYFSCDTQENTPIKNAVSADSRGGLSAQMEYI